MKRDLVRAARVVVPSTFVVAGLATFAPGRLELTLRVYALVLCAVALALALAALRRAYPLASPLRTQSHAGPRPGSRPASLARLEDVVALGAAGAFDFHRRLRPRLRALATARLANRRGVSLDDEPERARSIVGAETWELVRRDRPLPQDRLARGLPLEDLDRVLGSLEGI